MRDIILIIAFLFCFSAASPQIVVIKTTHYAVCIDEWSDWEEANLIIIVDLEKETVKIDNNFEDIFYIRVTEEETTGENDMGEYTSYKQICFDKNGTECFLTWTKWGDFDIISCLISYSNIQYGYLGQKIN